MLSFIVDTELYTSQYMRRIYLISDLLQGTAFQQLLLPFSAGLLALYSRDLDMMTHTSSACPAKLVVACVSPCHRTVDGLVESGIVVLDRKE